MRTYEIEVNKNSMFSNKITVNFRLFPILSKISCKPELRHRTRFSRAQRCQSRKSKKAERRSIDLVESFPTRPWSRSDSTLYYYYVGIRSYELAVRVQRLCYFPLKDLAENVQASAEKKGTFFAAVTTLSVFGVRVRPRQISKALDEVYSVFRHVAGLLILSF